MRVGNYVLEIVGADENVVTDTDGHVGLADGEPISVKMRNHDMRRAAAKVTVDGSPIGAWIVPAFGTPIAIERPADKPQRLTFFAIDSEGGKKAMLDLVAPQDLGVVSVTFIPEKKPELAPISLGLFASRGGDTFGGLRSGGGMFGGDFVTRGGGGGSFGFGKGFSMRSGGGDVSGAKPADGATTGPSDTPKAQSEESADQAQTGSSGSKLTAGGIGLGEKSDQQFSQGHLDLEPDATKHVVISLRLGRDPDRVLRTGPLATPVPAPLEGSVGNEPGRSDTPFAPKGAVKAPSVM
jgi:hypothetical protein